MKNILLVFGLQISTLSTLWLVTQVQHTDALNNNINYKGLRINNHHSTYSDNNQNCWDNVTWPFSNRFENFYHDFLYNQNESFSTTPPAHQPYVRLSISPQRSSTVWGGEAVFNVVIQSYNSFSGRVNLTVERPPSELSAHRFSNSIINLASNARATTTLSLSTKEGAAKIFSLRITVKVALQSNRSTLDTKQIDFNILRTPGRFSLVSLKTQNSSCGSYRASVVSLGNGTGIRFSNSTTSTISIPFSAGYAFSPKCKVGLVIPPVATVSNTPYHTAECWNLGFPLSNISLGRRIFGTDGRFKSAYFSPDDSLLLLETIANSQTAGHQSIYRLFDLSKGQLIGGTNGQGTFIESIILNGDIVTLNLRPRSQYTWRIR